MDAGGSSPTEAPTTIAPESGRVAGKSGLRSRPPFPAASMTMIPLAGRSLNRRHLRSARHELYRALAGRLGLKQQNVAGTEVLGGGDRGSATYCADEPFQ